MDYQPLIALVVISFLITYEVMSIIKKWYISFGSKYYFKYSGGGPAIFGGLIVLAFVTYLFFQSSIVNKIIDLASHNLLWLLGSILIGSISGYVTYMFLYNTVRLANEKTQRYIWALIGIIVAVVYYFIRTKG